MTATLSDFVERDGCARMALILLLLTSVGCMTYTWGYYEGFHNGTYSSLLLLPSNQHGWNSSTYNTSAQHHPPTQPPILVKSIEDTLPSSLTKSLPGSDDDGTQRQYTERDRQGEHAESEGIAQPQGADSNDEEAARAEAVFPAGTDTRRLRQLF